MSEVQIKCPKCSADLLIDKEEFEALQGTTISCLDCNAEIVLPRSVQGGGTPKFCSSCGTSITPNTKFCTKCGTKVNGLSIPRNEESEKMKRGKSIPHVFHHTHYLVRKKIFTLFSAAFHIYAPNGTVAFYSKQKAFTLRQDIRVYTGEDMQTEVLTILARNIIEFAATYDVIDPATKGKIGSLKRECVKSMHKEEWIIMDAENREIGFIQEDSMFIALIRRFIFDEMPQRFHGVVNGKQVCLFKPRFNPFVTKIALDYSLDTNGVLDRRLGIASAILLCAIEGKQG